MVRAHRWSLGLAIVALAIPGCTLLFPLDAFGPGDSGVADSATENSADVLGADALGEAGDASAEASFDDAGCLIGAGPQMARAVGTSGPVEFCIDSTEVTNAQYAKFMEAGAPHASLSATLCSWKSEFVPRQWPVPSGDNLPVDADWCSAYAYCAWAGKRLCGDRSGTSLTPGMFAQLSCQWYFACSNGEDGQHQAFYGSTFEAGVCADQGFLSPVASHPGCKGGIDVYDMMGNAYEWIDSCDNVDQCYYLGSAENTPPGFGWTCDQTDFGGSTDAGNVGGPVGIRCCWP